MYRGAARPAERPVDGRTHIELLGGAAFGLGGKGVLVSGVRVGSFTMGVDLGLVWWG